VTADLQEIPLFPLHTVLYPGGRLPLRIFEQRYLDMAKACFKQTSAFGICLILHGREAGEPAIPEEVGTVARIVDWDMPHLGVLNIVAQGEERFRIVDYQTERSGLLRAKVQQLVANPPCAVPGEFAVLAKVLKSFFDEMGEAAPPMPHYFEDAAWLGYRLSELLPIYREEKQRSLEIEDSLERLALIKRFLLRKGLLST
jgi:Lon protease-like protein